MVLPKKSVLKRLDEEGILIFNDIKHYFMQKEINESPHFECPKDCRILTEALKMYYETIVIPNIEKR